METFTLHRGTTPLLVSVPHDGTAVPADVAIEADEPPNGFIPGTLPGGAAWLVRYRADGYDAEDADGNYCSGQILHGEAMPRMA